MSQHNHVRCDLIEGVPIKLCRVHNPPLCVFKEQLLAYAKCTPEPHKGNIDTTKCSSCFVNDVTAQLMCVVISFQHNKHSFVESKFPLLCNNVQCTHIHTCQSRTKGMSIRHNNMVDTMNDVTAQSCAL